MHSGGELPFLSSGSQSAKPGAQPRKPFQPDGSAFPQEKPLRTVVHQTEEEKEDGGLFIPMERQENEESDRRKKTKKGTKRKRDGKCQEQGTMAHDLNLDDMLDRTLEDGAKQHNLTAVNVRNILHEVITNEHVVAMMKAAISETEDMPLFEPKMTRSKLKEVVEKGVVIPTWNISPIKTANEIKQFRVMVLTWKESMQTGLEASSSSTAFNFSMKALSLLCFGFGGGGGPMGTTSALMCLTAATSEDARSLDLFTPRGDEAVLSTSLSNKL
ncbi:hypothetical protein NN561_020047 [Cricetulus griseus]